MPASQPDPSYPKVKFLTAIWGERYIERFCALSLPSFLAPGNLPSLAQTTRLEVVIMTKGADIPYFEQNLSFTRLQTICPVRFVEIDDLITTGIYGVTLTLAYARPIIACGPEMLETHFVFMNADFVLADGSLRSLAKHIHENRSIVLGPSYRAISEELEPILDSLVDRSKGILDIAPRELVRMSLPHPHRTTVAKTFNQRAFSSSHPNQLFWQVDEHTILARYFLIFMLCLKPERQIDSVNCFCDYSFIPELCPSGDEVAMGDSDDFFMLELQNRREETFLLKQGEMSLRRIAASLQEWATTAHRRAASYDIVFHSRDVPARIGEVKAQAEHVIADIRKYLGGPKSHQNHFYWVMGVEAWKEYRQRQGLSYAPPELAPYRPGLRARYHLTRQRLKRLVRAAAKTARARNIKRLLIRTRWFVLYGPLPNTKWSRYWQLHRRVSAAIRSRGPKDALLVVGLPSQVRLLGPLPHTAEVITQLPLIEARGAESARYDQIVFFLAMDTDDFPGTLHELLVQLKQDGSLHLIAFASGKHPVFPRLVDVVFATAEIVGNHVDALTAYSAGSLLLRVSSRISHIARRRLLRYRRRWQLPVSVILTPVSLLSMGIAYLANTLQPKSGKRKLVGRCLGTWILVKTLGRVTNETGRERNSVTHSPGTAASQKAAIS